MKKSEFTEAQIVFAIKQSEQGVKVDEICRKIVADSNFCGRNFGRPTTGQYKHFNLENVITTYSGLEVFGRVNPAVGIVLGILDFTGATDALFKW